MQGLLSLFKVALRSAISAHYPKLTTEIPDIYGYALYTADDLPSVGPVANAESDLPVEPSDATYNYYRFLAVEWNHFDDFGLFDGVNRIISELHADASLHFLVKRERILRACLEVLCELEMEGIFGPRNDRRFIVICVTDSDDEIMMESAKLLNTTKAFECYAGEF